MEVKVRERKSKSEKDKKKEKKSQDMIWNDVIWFVMFIDLKMVMAKDMIWYDYVYWPQDGHGDWLKVYVLKWIKRYFNMILWSGRPLSDT